MSCLQITLIINELKFICKQQQQQQQKQTFFFVVDPKK